MTFQRWDPSGWRDIATLTLADVDPSRPPGRRARCVLDSDVDYAIEMLAASRARRAWGSVSLTAPVDLSARVMGDFDWRGIAAAVEQWVHRDVLLARLGGLADRLVEVMSQLSDFGCPAEAIERLRLSRTATRLTDWGLL